MLAQTCKKENNENLREISDCAGVFSMLEKIFLSENEPQK
jgi:hypothetical protein